MKLLGFVALFACFAAAMAADEQYCNKRMESLCVPNASGDGLPECNSTFPKFMHHQKHLHAFANLQVERSYNYLLLASHFGSHSKNRPGLEKLFLGLSNKAWEGGLNLIKYITKRGGTHNFRAQSIPRVETKTLQLNELPALAWALDTEKKLFVEARDVHELYSSHHKASSDPNHSATVGYDPEVAHYLDEKFLSHQADTIRKLAGYTNDLERLTASKDGLVDRYLFDEWLLKQE